MKTKDKTIIKENILFNIRHLEKIFKQTVEPWLLCSVSFKSYYSHLYEWLHWGEGNNNLVCLDNFLKLTISYLSNDTQTCFINNSNLETIVEEKDRLLVKKFIECGFYLGVDLRIDKNSNKKLITYNSVSETISLSSIKNTVTRDNFLLLLNNTGIETEELEIQTLYTSEKDNHRLLKMYEKELNQKATMLMTGYTELLANFISSKILECINKQERFLLSLDS